MIRIAERAGRKIGKKDSRYQADETLAVDELSPVRSIRPDWLCMANEQIQQREQSMEVLTEIEDRFWRLHFEDGVPVPVIARECEVSIRKVRTVLARAEAWLKSHRQMYLRGNDGEFGEDGVDGKEVDRGNDYDDVE
jgi:DNA-directed RNA polymerase specialized sigma24 family protein